MGRNDHIEIPDPVAKTEARVSRYHESEVRLHDEGDKVHRISGYASVFYDGSAGTEFEIWPGFVERVMPGTFDDAIKQDVRGLFNHNPNAILGRTGADTMALSVDKRGLFYSIDVGDTTVGRDTLEHIRRGDVTGSSFSFLITDEIVRTENKIDIREITGVDLFDVGPVTYPAYEATTTSARSAEIEALRERMQSRIGAVSTKDVLARLKRHNLRMRKMELTAGRSF